MALSSLHPFPDPDETGFVADLTAHQALLHAYLTTLLSRAADADDVLQQTNIALWRKRADFTPGTSFRKWALAVAYWEARAWLGRQSRKNWLVFDDDMASSITARFEDQPRAEPNESLAVLRECLATLKEKDRLLVLSYYQQENDLAECGRIFDRSPDSLKVSLHRIRNLLRRCITSRRALRAARTP